MIPPYDLDTSCCAGCGTPIGIERRPIASADDFWAYHCAACDFEDDANMSSRPPTWRTTLPARVVAFIDAAQSSHAALTAEIQRLLATNAQPSVFTAKVRERVPRFSQSEADLLRWVCKHPRPGKGRAVRWSNLAETLGVGSITASAICLALDLDPDEHIGEAHEDEGALRELRVVADGEE